MSPRTRARRLALCLFAFTFLLPLGCNSGEAAGQAAAKISGPLTMLPEYKARAPRTCSAVTSPPSAAVATVLVQCTMDAVSYTGLGLIQDVKLQMGASRKFDNWGDLGLAGIDSTALVYPLRGSYTGYFCRLASTVLAGQQACVKSVIPAAEGWCWKTSFGDYKCKMQGGAPKLEDAPPPTTF
jgi:hypothetical protein